MCYVSDEYRELLAGILQDTDTAEIDLAAKIYQLIVKQEKQGAALQYFLENQESIEFSSERRDSSHFSDDTMKTLKNRCDKLIDGILTKLIQQELACEQFYDKLWNAIENDALLDAEEKVYALYRLCTDERIPYFQLDDGICMDNDKFQEISMKWNREIKKARYILEAPLQQRTEQASLLNEILDICEDKEEKAVILAQVLAYSERRVLAGIMKAAAEREEKGKN